ncbi:MFS transporter [Adlercreutzia caecimuris]|uniref:MFS transporter n=1 Tax=Adlercreutzia caecimuris TaxID=671266 RepID=UPI0025708432|nr:MFS transporter [Adlercreutzia caecimuris]
MAALGGRALVAGIAGFSINMLLGVVYSWSVFVGSLEAQFAWVRTDTSMVFSISMVMLCAGQLVSGWLIARTSPRFVMGLSAALAALGFVSTATANGLAWVCVSYGVVCGLSVGLGANCVLATVLPWFPGCRGTVSGLLLAGVGLGTFALAPAVAAVLATWGWRTAFVALGGAFGVFLGFGAAVLRLPRPGELSEGRAAPQEVGAEGPSTPSGGMTPQAMVASPVFWMFFAWMVLISTGGMALVSNAVPAALEVLKDEGEAYLLASAAMGSIGAFNAAGRLGAGWLWDRAGARRAMTTVSAIYGCALLACVAAVELALFPLIVAGFMLLGAAYGGSVSVASAFTGERFGMAHYAMNYALVNANLVLASMVGPGLAGAAQVGAHTYLPAYGVLVLAAFAAILIARFLPAGRP